MKEENVDEATYPSDFKNPDGSTRSVAKKKTGRPVQHDQAMSGGRRKTVDEEKKPLPKNKMFRKAGNLGRDAISTPIDPEKRQKAYDRSKKIVKVLNQNEEKDPFGRPVEVWWCSQKGSGYDKAYQSNMKKIKELEQKEEVEQVDEDSRRMSNKQHTKRVRSNIKSFGSNYTPPSNYDPDANRGQGEVLTSKQIGEETS